jgi:hypothetical protein
MKIVRLLAMLAGSSKKQAKVEVDVSGWLARQTNNANIRLNRSRKKHASSNGDKRHDDTTATKIGVPKAMPDQRPVKPRLPDNFASFDIDPRGSGRRKPRRSLRPMHEPSEGAPAEAARFVKEADVLRGLGRKPQE